MIVIYSSNHETAPLLSDPLVEHNFDHQIRPIYKKIRKVRGKTGWLLRRYGYIFGAPKGDQIGLGHHALQIGAYVYEMTREKGLVGQRLSGEQIWDSTVSEMVIGWTDLSDEDIQLEAMKAQAYSRSRNDGKYHIKHNNCQHFILDLERRIMKFSDVIESAWSTVPIKGYGIIEATPSEASVSTIPSRHDSVASSTEAGPRRKTEPVLKIRELTHSSLVTAAIQAYPLQDMKNGNGVVNVVTTEITAWG